MRDLLLIGIGGGIGAVARYKLGGAILNTAVGWRFPLHTLVVNLLGCLAAGLLARLAERYSVVGPDLRLFLFTGLLGGFTTFSAFGLETVSLLQRQIPLVAVANVITSVLGALFALWLGMKVVP